MSKSSLKLVPLNVKMIQHKDNHDGILTNTKLLSLDEGLGILPVGSEAVMAPPSKSTDAADNCISSSFE